MGTTTIPTSAAPSTRDMDAADLMAASAERRARPIVAYAVDPADAIADTVGLSHGERAVLTWAPLVREGGAFLATVERTFRGWAATSDYTIEVAPGCLRVAATRGVAGVMTEVTLVERGENARAVWDYLTAADAHGEELRASVVVSGEALVSGPGASPPTLNYTHIRLHGEGHHPDAGWWFQIAGSGLDFGCPITFTS